MKLNEIFSGASPMNASRMVGSLFYIGIIISYCMTVSSQSERNSIDNPPSVARNKQLYVEIESPKHLH